MEEITIRDIAIIVTLIINFGGLVWSAAVWAQSTKQLTGAVTDLKYTVKQVTDDLNEMKIDYNARISVLEDRNRRV